MIPCGPDAETDQPGTRGCFIFTAVIEPFTREYGTGCRRTYHDDHDRHAGRVVRRCSCAGAAGVHGAAPAHWIAPAGTPADTFTVFHARRTFLLEKVPARFVVHVSADNRYRLYVNGMQM